MKHPINDNSVFSIDVIDPIVQDTFDICVMDELQSALENSLVNPPQLDLALSLDMHQVLAQLDSSGKHLASLPTLLTLESEKLLPSV